MSEIAVRPRDHLEFREIVSRRFLPTGAQLQVQVGCMVEPDTNLGHCREGGPVQTVTVEHDERGITATLLKREGDPVRRGEVIAQHVYLFGLGCKDYAAPMDGVITGIEDRSGTIIVSAGARSCPAQSYGRVVEAEADGTISIMTRASLIWGRLGWGEPVAGRLHYLKSTGEAESADPGALDLDMRGEIVFVGRRICWDHMERALALGIGGLVGVSCEADALVTLRDYVQNVGLDGFLISRRLDDAARRLVDPSRFKLSVLSLEGAATGGGVSDALHQRLQAHHGLPCILEPQVAPPRVRLPRLLLVDPAYEDKTVEAEVVASNDNEHPIASETDYSLARVCAGPLAARYGRVEGHRVEAILDTGRSMETAPVTFNSDEAVAVPIANLELLR